MGELPLGVTNCGDLLRPLLWGLTFSPPPWARDPRRPCRASLALLRGSAPTGRLGCVGTLPTFTDPRTKPVPGCLDVRVSGTVKYPLHGVGLPDAILFGRDELQVQVACEVPEQLLDLASRWMPARVEPRQRAPASQAEHGWQRDDALY